MTNFKLVWQKKWIKFEYVILFGDEMKLSLLWKLNQTFYYWLEVARLQPSKTPIRSLKAWLTLRKYVLCNYSILYIPHNYQDKILFFCLWRFDENAMK